MGKVPPSRVVGECSGRGPFGAGRGLIRKGAHTKEFGGETAGLGLHRHRLKAEGRKEVPVSYCQTRLPVLSTF